MQLFRDYMRIVRRLYGILGFRGLNNCQQSSGEEKGQSNGNWAVGSWPISAARRLYSGPSAQYALGLRV